MNTHATAIMYKGIKPCPVEFNSAVTHDLPAFAMLGLHEKVVFEARTTRSKFRRIVKGLLAFAVEA
jgi:hypothetical protein